MNIFNRSVSLNKPTFSLLSGFLGKFKKGFCLNILVFRSGSLAATLRSKTVCTECGSTNLLRDYDSGELVCEKCGFVLSTTLIDQGPEWRAFDQEQRDKLPRVGAPVTWTIHDKGLSTTIGWQDRDASGRRLSPEERARLYRLRKWQRRSKVSDSTQRNLAHALSEMSKIAYKLNLPTKCHRDLKHDLSPRYSEATHKWSHNPERRCRQHLHGMSTVQCHQDPRRRRRRC